VSSLLVPTATETQWEEEKRFAKKMGGGKGLRHRHRNLGVNKRQLLRTGGNSGHVVLCQKKVQNSGTVSKKVREKTRTKKQLLTITISW